MENTLLTKLFGSPQGDQGSKASAPQPQETPQSANLMGAIQAGVSAIQDPQNSGVIEGALKSFAAPGVQNEGPVATKEQQLEAMSASGTAVGTGGMRSVFETSDFLFGETPQDQKSAFRQSVEQLDGDLKAQHPIINGLASGIGQFAVAMIGLGKVAGVAKAVIPGVEAGAAAVEGLKGGKAALETGKAATAGAIAFDPHAERLSNLIQGTPLANPFNAWLAAKPDDTAAEGRLKNAMESLGMDVAITGTLLGSLKVFKFLKEGNAAAASKAVDTMEADRAAHIQSVETPTPTVDPQGAATDVQPVLSNKTAPTEIPTDPKLPQSTDTSVGGDTGNPSGQALGGLPANEPTAAGSVEGGSATAPANPKPPESTFTPATTPITGPQAADIADQARYSLEHSEADWNTMLEHGGFEGTIAAGKTLSPDLGQAFYDRFNVDSEVSQFIELAAHMKEEELTKNGFRGVLTDSTLNKQVHAYAALAGTDPAGVMGMLQQAGAASRSLTAKMIVSGSYAAKAFQDASLLAMRRKLGDYSEFGSLAAMEEAIGKRLTIATTLLKVTDEIRSQAGRSLRANRGKPFDPSLFEGVSKDRLYDLLAAADGKPENLKFMADPGLWRKLIDTVNYLRVSSLVSGPKTQLINIMSNGYMLAFRPMERMLGGAVMAAKGGAMRDAGVGIIKESMKQYAYMGSSMLDGFSSAVKAFVDNDSVLRPHGSENYGANLQTKWQVPGTQGFGENYFKPMDSTPNIIHNALSVPLSAAGMPTRLLGGVDELVKQITYRSKLAASAHMEGSMKALDAGLTGKPASDFVKAYVKRSLDEGFDAEGRGLNKAALDEANRATFQQDLLPKTWGKNMQSFITNDRTQLSRLILPFVKTPTNVIRYGWKMTPGLNMLQEEFRQAISGAHGMEAKAQAIGQMSMGSIFMGAASYLSANGMISGGGPSDPNTKQQLLATGWQPYSIITHNEDGTVTYTPFSKYDPVGLPFGIIADIQDALHIHGEDAEGNPNVQSALGSLALGLAKEFSSRTYLMSLKQAIDAISDPDRSGAKFGNSMAQSMVPFSSATRQLSSDSYLRDARSLADAMLQVTPGMSSTLPPRYNWLGQPILNRQGLWTDDNGSLVDHETQRLGLQAGTTLIGVPSPNVLGVDLREITTVDGKSAYSEYQRLAGQPTPKSTSLRDQVAKLMRTEGYQKAPDGARDVKGSKLWLLSGVVSKYRTVASKVILRDPNVMQAVKDQKRIIANQFGHLREPTASKPQETNVNNLLSSFGQ